MENNQKKHISKAWLVIAGTLLICVAVVCLLLFLMNGKTTITGENEGTKVQEKIVCTSNDTAYPLFSYDNSDQKSIEVTATFQDDELDSIALIYKLYYSDAEMIEKSESVNHGELNILSQDEGFGPDAFNATYGKLKDALQLSLFAKKDDLNNKAMKYFMLSKLNMTPYTQEKITKLYNEQGLDCEIRE